MSGIEFWLIFGALAVSSTIAYVVGYRSGYTDGAADARRWGNK